MNQNLQISYAKAICMVLMVLGHAGVPARVHSFSCLFHMPLFFFVSGYLFKEKHLQSFVSFLKRKLQTIWKPYVLWTIFSILIHNAVLNPLHIVDTSYSFTQMITKAFCALAMISTESYILPGFWFLRDLFYSLMVAWCLIALSKRFKSSRGQLCFLFASIAFSLLMAVVINCQLLWIPNVKTSTFLALSYLLTGYVFNKLSFDMKHKYSLWIGLLMMLAIWFVSGIFTTSMTIIEGVGDILLYYLLSVFAMMGLLFLCDALSKKPMSALVYIGQHSMEILIFHFMSFKLLSYILICLKDYPMDYMARFNIPGYWYFYALVGVLIPLVIAYLKASCKTWLQGGKEACLRKRADKS